MPDKIVLQHLYKIFGPHPEKAIDYLKQGKNKDEIFNQAQTTIGVQDANLTIREGEVFVIMGLSGSGKSTLIRLLNRLIEPTRGQVLVDGEDITQMTKAELIQLRRKEMAMVFQSFALMPHRSVLENAAFALDVAGLPRAEQQKRAMQALETVGLQANANSYPDELSGGMQQRVGLARALATKPSILLMDEAFSALDPLIRTEMQDELLKLQKKNAHTIVFISHDLDEAIRIGDRIAIMEDGAIIQVGTPQEIINEPANDFVRSFFYGVDVSKVYTAESIAEHDRERVFTVSQTPAEVAKKLNNTGAKDGVLIDHAEQVLGIVNSQALNQQLQQGKLTSWNETLYNKLETIPMSMPLNKVLYQVANSDYPVAVVNNEGAYIGNIDKRNLLLTIDKARR
ncbi:MAG: glycine betaine/L-proline ABC transporter ATP-binding protein ProV [Thioalkalispiraceae bacterium]|jgi:glycine betaine/proline transport system ATP-binding protein